jgi:hypothetical protein
MKSTFLIQTTFANAKSTAIDAVAIDTNYSSSIRDNSAALLHRGFGIFA